jgi:hypothetical protein
MKIIKTIQGANIRLLSDRITEPKGKGMYGQTFYALYKDIRESYKLGLDNVFIQEQDNPVMSMNRSFGRLWGLGGPYKVGCRAFTEKTFLKILRAAGIKNPKVK